MKYPSGICISFTCRWRKVGGVSLCGRGAVRRQSMRKDGWQRFLSHSDKDPFDPEGSRQIHAASPQRDTGLWSGNASTVRFPSHISTTAVIIHLQTDSKELTLTIHGHLAKASPLTPVAMATASHTHMCWIRGQGSWVVLGGLNGALCVIIQTSSNPRLRKVMPKNCAQLCLQQTPVTGI